MEINGDETTNQADTVLRLQNLTALTDQSFNIELEDSGGISPSNTLQNPTSLLDDMGGIVRMTRY